jgi:nucleoside-diphosphate-sugar epimerase
VRTVAVTGAGGLIGRALIASLRSSGLATRRLVRSPEGPDDRRFVLGEPVASGTLEGCDALIHAAHDFSALGPAARRANVEGSLRLFDSAREAGVGNLVFVSSISAFEGCASEYGRGKMAVEARAREQGAAIARPGLVYGGAGGMFASLARLCRLPLLPVFDGGGQPLHLVGLDEVARDLVYALSWDAAARSVPVTMAHPAPVAFRDLLASLARGSGRTLRTVSLPSGLALAPLRVLEAAGLPLRFRSDSLVSLLNPNPSPDWSVQERLGLSYRPFRL